MIRISFALILALMTSIPALADGTKVLKLVENSIVYISTETSNGERFNGSGVITKEDEVLTNCHVIQKSTKITVQFSNGEVADATIKGQVGDLDLCALNTLTQNRKTPTIGKIKDVKTGQVVYAVGNPLALKSTISDGIVGSIRDTGLTKIIQITAPISSGSSGGGLFDSNGKLLGLTTFTLINGQNLNFAIPVEYRNTLGLKPYKPVLNEAKDSSQSSKPISLACSGKKVMKLDFKVLLEDQVSLLLDIDFDKNWVEFKGDWGCVLDVGTKFNDDYTPPACSSRIKLSPPIPGINKHDYSFYEENRKAGLVNSFSINRSTGLMKSSGTIVDDAITTYDLELSCSVNSRKF